MENASPAFLDAVRLSMPAVPGALGKATIDPALLTAAERLQYEGFLRREDTARQILTLKKAGHSIKKIVRRTRHSRRLMRQTVRGTRGDIFLIRQAPSTLTCPFWMPSGRQAAATAPNSGAGSGTRVSKNPCALSASGQRGVDMPIRCRSRD